MNEDEAGQDHTRHGHDDLQADRRPPEPRETRARRDRRLRGRIRHRTHVSAPPLDKDGDLAAQPRILADPV